MRCLFGFVYVIALSALLALGCGNAGECGNGVCSCTEEGIRAAIEAGEGPYTFNCDGKTTVVTKAEIVIDSDVTLDGDDASVGDNAISANRQDVFILDVTQTGATTVADATLLFEGADVEDNLI